MKTIIFQRGNFAGRPAGMLTRWYDGEVHEPSHYCIVVSDEVYDRMRYNTETTGEVDDEGSPIVRKTEKPVTYVLDIKRFLAEYPQGESYPVHTDDITLVQEVPRG